MSDAHSSVYASFSRRALARFIDLCVVLAPCGILYFVNRFLGFPVRYTSLSNWAGLSRRRCFTSADFPGVFLTFAAVKLCIAFPYFALMEGSRGQGTIGKQVVKIKVTDLEGNRISFGRAIGRYFLKVVSSFEFMLGYLISFSDQRQTWHSWLVGSLTSCNRGTSWVFQVLWCFSSHMPRSLATPADPRQPHLLRLLCIDFWIFDSIIVCFVGLDEAISSFRDSGLSYAYVMPCVRFNRFVR